MNDFVILGRYIVKGGVLQIVNVSHSDHGFYACVARTGLDQDRAVAQLTVLGELFAHSALVLPAVPYNTGMSSIGI